MYSAIVIIILLYCYCVSVCLSVCHPSQDLVSNQKFLLQLSTSPDHHPQPASSLPEDKGKEGKKEERRKKAAGMGASSKPGAHGREKKTQKVKGSKGRSRGGDEEEYEERSLQFMTTQEVLYYSWHPLCRHWQR